MLGNRILVICAKPDYYDKPKDPRGAEQLIEIEVSSWGRLDVDGPWEEFHSKIDDFVIQTVKAFQPEVVVGVDWSSLEVYKKLKPYLSSNPFAVPFVWSAYRIFTRTAVSNRAKEIIQKGCRAESESFAQAEKSIVLSKSDQLFVAEHLASEKLQRDKPAVVFPHIRQSMLSIPPINSPQGEHTCNVYPHHRYLSSPAKRKYFLACVRLSPEKEPERFVEVAIEMEKRGLFDELDLIPALCASVSSDYAKKITSRLVEAVPRAVIINSFLGPRELAEVFSETRLNFHPPLYDAYGMTIVEAASQGVPSVIHCGELVGAADFLVEEFFPVDFTVDVKFIVDRIEQILKDETSLARLGQRALIKARQYTAFQNGRETLKLFSDALKRKSSSKKYLTKLQIDPGLASLSED